MNYHIVDPNTDLPFDVDVTRYPVRSEGKTKINRNLGDGEIATTHKPILTAFDKPAYSGVAEDKGPPSAISTAILYRLLEQTGLATAHRWILNANTTREIELDMLPFEFIWRTFNDEKSSRHKRFPDEAPVGARYPEPLHEIGLKWSAIDANTGDEVMDPFLVLDTNGNPITYDRGKPLLTSQKIDQPIKYEKVVKPGTKHEIPMKRVLDAVQLLQEHMPTIRDYRRTIQSTAASMYGEIWLLNLDGKWEGGLDALGKFRLGDTIELDSMRLALVRRYMTGDIEHETGHGLGMSIEPVASKITRIISAVPTSKQVYRDKVRILEKLRGKERKDANDAAARAVVQTHYIPVAMALSDRFGKEIGYILKAL